MLSEGEYVIKASSARQLGKPLLDQINTGKFYDGGETSPLSDKSESTTSSGNTNNINISVNLSGNGKESQSDEDQGGQEKSDKSADDMKKLSERIKKQVVQVIAEEQRPGGLLQGTRE